MYAAYQSHQSCGGASASNVPWCSAVSCKSAASEAISISVLPFPARKPVCDLLQHPTVPVRIAERGTREVGAPSLRVEPRRHGHVYLADVHAATDEVVAGGVDVFDYDKRLLGRSR